MSCHVSQNFESAVVTGGQSQCGRTQSHDPASGLGCHFFPQPHLYQTGGTGKKRRAREDDSEMCLCETAKNLEPCWIYRTENAEE